MENEKKELILRDWLAIERTHLANERTFLAYFRSFLVFASTGVAILQLDFLQDVWYLGIVFLMISPLFLLIGVIKYKFMKRKIRKYYQQNN